jgi:hypothetical protein
LLEHAVFSLLDHWPVLGVTVALIAGTMILPLVMPAKSIVHEPASHA